MILDDVIVPERNRQRGTPPGGGYRYYQDEVEQATDLAKEWSDALMDGMQPFDIVEWLQVVYPPITKDDAVQLQQSGVKPDDLDNHPTDRGPDLASRLQWGNITAEQIVIEVEKRRAS